MISGLSLTETISVERLVANLGLPAWLTAGALLLISISVCIFQNVFRVDSWSLSNIFNWIVKYSQRHIACHRGVYTLYRTDKKAKLLRVRVEIILGWRGARFVLTPPDVADQTIRGKVAIEAGRLVLSTPEEPGIYTAVFRCTGSNGDNCKIGVFAGTRIDHSPYAGRAIMCKEHIVLTDRTAMRLLEADVVTVVTQEVVDEFIAKLKTTMKGTRREAARSQAQAKILQPIDG